MRNRSSGTWGLKKMIKRIRLGLGWILLLIGICSFSGCAKQENLTFTGTVEEVGETSMVVYTTEVPSLERIRVSFRELDLTFEPVAGQRVVVTVKPEIEETYPAKADAEKIALEEQEESQAQQVAQENRISAEQAYRMMQQEDVIVLDVRREDEFIQGHIEHAMLIPLAELVNQAPDRIPDKNATILVYCRSGNRSAKAVLQLKGLGYGNVYDFGGIEDWPYETVQE